MDPLAGARPIHTRTLDVEVSETSDGVWSARGELVDLRKSGFVAEFWPGDGRRAAKLNTMQLKKSPNKGTDKQ